MAARRKLTAQERSRKEREIWEEFRNGIMNSDSIIDAHTLMENAPYEGRPGRRFYSNFGTFLQAFIVPDGAGLDELKLYIGLMRRINDSGEVGLKAGTAQMVIDKLRAALKEHGC